MGKGSDRRPGTGYGEGFDRIFSAKAVEPSPPFAAPAGIVSGPVAAKDKPFYDFWYGHMLDDLMQPPLCGISHVTARYIWDAASRCRAQGGNDYQQAAKIGETL